MLEKGNWLFAHIKRRTLCRSPPSPLSSRCIIYFFLMSFSTFQLSRMRENSLGLWALNLAAILTSFSAFLLQECKTPLASSVRKCPSRLIMQSHEKSKWRLTFCFSKWSHKLSRLAHGSKRVCVQLSKVTSKTTYLRHCNNLDGWERKALCACITEWASPQEDFSKFALGPCGQGILYLCHDVVPFSFC